MSVKCADCGFLALRHTKTRQLLDAELLFRTKGYNLQTIDRGVFTYDEQPICFKRVINFRTEGECGLGRSEDQARASVQKERECGEFTPWIQGFTPREHNEMLQEAERLKWQGEQATAASRYQRERDESARAFQAEQSRLTRNHNLRMAVLTLVSICIAAFAAFRSKSPAPVTVTVQQPADSAATPSQPAPAD